MSETTDQHDNSQPAPNPAAPRKVYLDLANFASLDESEQVAQVKEFLAAVFRQSQSTDSDPSHEE